MELHLLFTYRQLCSLRASQPVRELEVSLSSVRVLAGGEAFIDAGGAETPEQFDIVIELLDDLLQHWSRHVPTGEGETAPSSVRLKLSAPRCASNGNICRLCAIFPVARSPAYGAATVGASAPVPVWIESIDVSGCVLVSLAGGRALRDAARRNIHLKHVFASGSSMNEGTSRQLLHATAWNRAQVDLPASKLRMDRGTAAVAPARCEGWRPPSIDTARRPVVSPPANVARTLPAMKEAPTLTQESMLASHSRIAAASLAADVATPDCANGIRSSAVEEPLTAEPFWEALTDLMPSLQHFDKCLDSTPHFTFLEESDF